MHFSLKGEIINISFSLFNYQFLYREGCNELFFEQIGQILFSMNGFYPKTSGYQNWNSYYQQCDMMTKLSKSISYDIQLLPIQTPRPLAQTEVTRGNNKVAAKVVSSQLTGSNTKLNNILSNKRKQTLVASRNTVPLNIKKKKKSNQIQYPRIFQLECFLKKRKNKMKTKPTIII